MIQTLRGKGVQGSSRCAYSVEIAFEQEKLVLCLISHLTIKHTPEITL